MADNCSLVAQINPLTIATDLKSLIIAVLEDFSKANAIVIKINDVRRAFRNREYEMLKVKKKI